MTFPPLCDNPSIQFVRQFSPERRFKVSLVSSLEWFIIVCVWNKSWIISMVYISNVCFCSFILHPVVTFLEGWIWFNSIKRVFHCVTTAMIFGLKNPSTDKNSLKKMFFTNCQHQDDWGWKHFRNDAFQELLCIEPRKAETISLFLAGFNFN